MSKHTPGPWRARSSQFRTSMSIESAQGTFIAETSIMGPEADAALIAAAPELLEAAKRALPALMHSEPRIANALFKAINKAEGNTNENK